MNLKHSLLLVLFIEITRRVSGSNILGLFLTHSPSHAIIHMSIIRTLVERGHNVTVITSIPPNIDDPPCRYIFLKNYEATPDKNRAVVHASKDGQSHLYLRTFKILSVIENVAYLFRDFALDPDFINFMKEDNQFDLVILGYMFNQYQLGVAAHFKCPVVLSFVVEPFGHVSRLIGSGTYPAFVPLSPLMDSRPMDFTGRIHNLILSFIEWVMMKKIDFNLRRIYYQHFPIDKYPSYSDVKENISLILSNYHFSEGTVRPLVPGLIEIGGIQIKDKPDELPKDIDEFLNKSPNGAIFFSLGSNVRDKHLGANASEIIFKVLSKLPYNVIWKYDQAEGQRNASNILFKKWLPQNDILSHRNIKLFITHTGKGSMSESEYHGVPMVALPIMLEQFNNAEAMELKGHGVKLNYQTMTEDSFREAILNVIEGDKYRSAVQKFSRLYRDRPLTARENVIYWIEYVIRHRGAPHMQSPLKKMNILQESSIDIILFLILVIYLILKAIKLLGKFLIMVFRLLRNMRNAKSKNE